MLVPAFRFLRLVGDISKERYRILPTFFYIFRPKISLLLRVKNSDLCDMGLIIDEWSDISKEWDLGIPVVM